MKPEDLYNAYYKAGDDTDFAAEESLLLSLVQKEHRGKLLDIGCGAGRTGAELKKLGFEVTGVDHSQEAVKLCQARGIEAKLADLDAGGLPFGDGTIDIAWAGDVLEHVFDPINMLVEVNRVLKPGGKLYLNVPNEFPLRTRLALLLKRRSCQSYTYKSVGVDHHHTHFSFDLVAYMLSKARFKTVWFGSFVRWPFRFIRGEHLSNSSFLGSEFGRNFFVIVQK
jgi:SAM-dependent methyltransferase